MTYKNFIFFLILTSLNSEFVKGQVNQSESFVRFSNSENLIFYNWIDFSNRFSLRSFTDSTNNREFFRKSNYYYELDFSETNKVSKKILLERGWYANVVDSFNLNLFLKELNLNDTGVTLNSKDHLRFEIIPSKKHKVFDDSFNDTVDITDYQISIYHGNSMIFESQGRCSTFEKDEIIAQLGKGLLIKSKNQNRFYYACNYTLQVLNKDKQGKVVALYDYMYSLRKYWTKDD